MDTVNKKNVFFYPAWYPHRGDVMFGLFVKRHAEAVVPFVNVGVVFACGENRATGERYETVYVKENGVHTVHIYFRKTDSFLLNGYRYWKAVRKGYKTLSAQMGSPHVNHVHVLTRAGLFPLFQKIFRGIPYLVTEHWSRYLPQNRGAYAGFLRMRFTEAIVKRAYAVLPVSPRLADAMRGYGLNNERYIIVNNVVDTDLFTPVEHGNVCTRWLHISCFDEDPKNITGLLRAFASAYAKNTQLGLTLVGDGIDLEASKRFAAGLGLAEGVITFTGLLQGEALRNEFRKHHAFVMFSRYENQPVVIIESFACGLPVVATAVGSIPEMLADHRGITVSSEDEPALAEALLLMGEGRFVFSREKIRRYAVEHFSFSEVGKRLYELYLAATENISP